MYFSEKLMELRKKAGMSQEQLGNRINVSRQTVSKWELGDTTPELSKLIELSGVFGVSIDELVGNRRVDEDFGEMEAGAVPEEAGQRSAQNATQDTPVRVYLVNGMEYEYRSKRCVRGVPLVHIHLGRGLKKAKGIIAIGNVAQGVIALGGISLGIVSVGGLSAGLIGIGGVALGLLLALGGLSVGAVAIGGAAVGVLAMGGGALGKYAMGGAAIASDVAMGGYASAHVAVGEKAVGEVAIEVGSRISAAEFEQILLREFPKMPGVLAALFRLFFL